ncbi:hypothetical protein P691DRAFT_780080 [Macrolepiota fuliginosa MF-IS2]|uniref:BTB domain-containing protein n=1 Tax=Macrolepiota fuliginosa MF-IS2 TaxID=1400762 RepID=A0A9P5WYZ7_9AGAR|nr:hypothetical protein P691DRAFT_780080 [Macrolepiota fuliginosa MF-IS2]
MSTPGSRTTHPLPDPSDQSVATIVRDEKYYFFDGSVVILAGDRLFRIHQSLFELGSGFFRTLFSLPQGVDTEGDSRLIEGRSDENPIIFQDTLDDFRALCWALYSRPPAIAAQLKLDTVDVSKLISVLAMSHKYDFPDLRTWCLDVLESHLVVSPASFIGKCGGWDNVGRVLELAQQCDRSTLMRSIEQEWLQRISGSSKAEQISAFLGALDVAEFSGGLRDFHGRAYYTYLKATGIFDAHPLCTTITIDIGGAPSSYMNQDLDFLDAKRQLRIYKGFWSLSQLRLRLTQAPKLPDCPSCSNHTKTCIPAWQSRWNSILSEAEQQGRCLDDPGKLLGEVWNSLSRRPITIPHNNWSTIGCHRFIVEHLETMMRKFNGGIAEHFIVP